MTDDLPESTLKGDAKIIAEAKRRFEQCRTYYSNARKNWVEDTKFANGDSVNNFQWQDSVRAQRTNKPSLTINKVRQHNLQIINDAKQNKPGVNIRPTGGDATYQAAQVFEDIVRFIEYQSNAEVAYDTATEHQVKAGYGVWRVITDYVDDDSFDQDIFIRRIPNPLSVYLDPDIKEFDGSDAAFGFVFEEVPKDRFLREYPDDIEDAGQNVLGIEGEDGWLTEEHVRVAEYYRRTMRRDRLYAFSDQGQQLTALGSEMSPEEKAMVKALAEADPQAVQTRSVMTDKVEWFKIAGDKIIDRRDWPGKFIPLVRVIGEETLIEGKYDCKGHTRYMIDAQRMYNYWTSEATAQVAFQTKTPWTAPAEAIEGLEQYWSKANLEEASILPYNQYNEDGEKLDGPKRLEPPIMATAYIQGMQITQNEMMMSSGQYQSQFGQNENATSGKAINERQRQGDNATYHFIDNLAVAIRFTGKILIDLIPKIYDTARVVRIMSEDGTQTAVKIDPQAQQAMQVVKQQQEQQAAVIFNPAVGRYEVESDIGPGYATRRQEAFNAMTQIASQNQEFMQVGGDLLWRAADFPMADELAERWARTISPAVKGEAPPPEVQQMQQQLQMTQNAVVELQQQLKNKQMDAAIKIDQKNIDSYDAETRRITAIGNAGPIVSPEQLQPLIMQTIMQMLGKGSPEEGGGGQSGAPAIAPPPSPPIPANEATPPTPAIGGAA